MQYSSTLRVRVLLFCLDLSTRMSIFSLSWPHLLFFRLVLLFSFLYACRAYTKYQYIDTAVYVSLFVHPHFIFRRLCLCAAWPALSLRFFFLVCFTASFSFFCFVCVYYCTVYRMLMPAALWIIFCCFCLLAFFHRACGRTFGRNEGSAGEAGGVLLQRRESADGRVHEEKNKSRRSSRYWMHTPETGLSQNYGGGGREKCKSPDFPLWENWMYIYYEYDSIEDTTVHILNKGTLYYMYCCISIVRTCRPRQFNSTTRSTIMGDTSIDWTALYFVQKQLFVSVDATAYSSIVYLVYYKYNLGTTWGNQGRRTLLREPETID